MLLLHLTTLQDKLNSFRYVYLFVNLKMALQVLHRLKLEHIFQENTISILLYFSSTSMCHLPCEMYYLLSENSFSVETKNWI